MNIGETKMNNVDDIIKLIDATKDKEVPQGKLHYIWINVVWIIVLLVVAICILLSIKLTDIDSQTIIFYVTNFATILSIILSISSILFAYFTSRDTQSQYVAMGKALEAIRATNWQIMFSNYSLVSQVGDIAKDVCSLNNKYDINTVLNSLVSNSTNAKDLSGNDIPQNSVCNAYMGVS